MDGIFREMLECEFDILRKDEWKGKYMIHVNVCALLQGERHVMHEICTVQPYAIFVLLALLSALYLIFVNLRSDESQ